jgi:membrane-associated phospholipid phosphatase
MNGTEKLGDLLPIAAMGFSGLVALSNHDQKLSQSSLASLEAGTAGLVIAMAGKYAIGRMRPEAELGASEFNSFNSANGDSSFPSIHTTVAWAAITPYAKAYHAPWLYGVAALTNVARVSSRKHWFSDTVGGSILGYALGNLFWENRNLGSKAGPQIYAVPNEIGLKWRTP